MGATLLVVVAALLLGATGPDDEVRLKELQLKVLELDKGLVEAERAMLVLQAGKEGELTADEERRLADLKLRVADITRERARTVVEIRALEEILREKLHQKEADLEGLVRRLLQRMEETEAALRKLEDRLEQGLAEERRAQDEAARSAYEHLRRSGGPWRELKESPSHPALRDGHLLVAKGDGRLVLWDPVRGEPVDVASIEENRRNVEVREILKSRTVTLDLTNVPLSQAVKYFEEVSGLTIRVSPEIDLADIEVTLKVTDLPLANALDLITDHADLGYQLRGGEIHIIGPLELERLQAQAKDRELEARAHELALRIREERSVEEREELKALLLDVLARSFDLRIDLREGEIHDLEKKIDSLRDEFERRIAQKERLIQRRFEDLTGQGRDPW